ncbi:hypothetical protein [Sphingobium tyrosinilyticum]|uniref:DNA-binding protein n=1 Tax=Sphingobium tyrosinilyticum TaxID=2715436 RepID=A0ABV9F068_9SPHN
MAELMLPREAAAYMCMTGNELEIYRRSWMIVCVRIGRKIRYRKGDCDAFLWFHKRKSSEGTIPANPHRTATAKLPDASKRAPLMRPEPNPENEDPLFAGILKSADLVRYIAQNAECYPIDAFSAATWAQMLSEVAGEADKIIGLCGVTNLEAHHEDVWGIIGQDRNDLRIDYRPYGDSHG